MGSVDNLDKRVSRISYNPEIDLLRLFFSVIIVLYHIVHVPGFKSIFQRGFLAVEFFFLVSGYLMAAKIRSEKAPDTDRFIIHKLAPIYPVVFVSTIIAFILRMIPVGGTSLQEWLSSSFLSFFEISMVWLTGISAGRSYNGPTWYIAAMVIALMIVYPIFKRGWRYFSFIGSLLLALICYSIIFRYSKELGVHVRYHWITTLGVIRAIAGISLGVFLNECCYRATEAYRITATGNRLFFLLKSALFIIILGYMTNGLGVKMAHRIDYVFIFLMGIFLFLVFTRWGSFGLLDKFNFKWCASLSLYLYLNHRGMTHFLTAMKFNLTRTETLLVFCLGVLLSMGLCFLIVKYGSRLIKGIERICFIPKKIQCE